MNKIQTIYNTIFSLYGPQGWWPLLECKGTNPTKTGSIQGYHPNDYSYPKNNAQVFEICVGSILTQNTSWSNVEKALLNLKKRNALNTKGMMQLSDGKLRELIKVAGYYNQKARYLRGFLEFFKTLKKVPSREELLNIKGIGPETADSMLLYAFKVPSFVVDSYTKRIFSYCGLIQRKATYDEIKALCEQSIEPDLKIYQEFHALLVEHAKRYYSKKPFGLNCPLKKLFL